MFAHVHQCHVNQWIGSSEVWRSQNERPLERLLGQIVKRNIARLSGLLKEGGAQPVVSGVIARGLLHMTLQGLNLLVRF
jgi:hypothetical protein